MAFFSRRTSRWLLGTIALVAAVLVLAPMAIGQGFPFYYPIAPPGTPIGNVPSVANTRGDVTWGPISLDAGSLSPGSAGQVLGTQSSGPATQWTYTSAVPVQLYGAKCDGSTDDSTAINACIMANAGTGTACLFPACASPYVVHNPLVLSAGNIALLGSPGAVLKSTIVSSPPVAGSLFYAIASPSFDGSTVGTLNGTPAVGAKTVSVTVTGVTPVQGDYIRFSHGFSAAVYLEVSVTGTGPYTVTLDRPMAAPFVSGDGVSQYTAIPQNVLIDGRGMTIAGTGDLYAELEACRNCTMRNVRVSGAYGSLRASTFMASYDEGSYNSSFENWTIDGTGNSSSVSAPVTEGGETMLIRGITSTNITGNGPALVDCVNCGMENVRTQTAGGWGQCIGTQGTSLGSINAWSSNGYSSQTSGAGLVIDKATAPRARHYASVAAGSYGVQITSNATDAIVDGATTQGSTTAGITNSGVGSILKHLSLTETGSVDALVTTTSMVVDGFDITSGGSAFTGEGIDVSGTNTIVKNGTITLTTASRIAIGVTTGNVDVSNTTVSAAQSSTYGIFANGGTITVGPNNTLSAPTTAISGAYSTKLVGASIADDGSGNTTLTSTGGAIKLADSAGTVAQFSGGGTDFASFGSSPGSAGSVRCTSNTTCVGVNGNAVLSTDGTPNVTLASPNTVNLKSGSTVVQALDVASGDYTAYGATPGTNGHVRCTSGDDCVDSPGNLILGSGAATGVYEGNAGTTAQLTYTSTSAGAFDWYSGASLLLQMSAANGISVAQTGYSSTFGGSGWGVSTAPFGAAYFGAGNAGYTTFQAIAGSHNSQDNIDQYSEYDLRTTNASFGPFNAQSYLIGSGHGVRVECQATGRVVTSGSGGSFWTVSAPHTYACTQVATTAWNGSSSFGNNAWYGHCDCSGGTCTSPTSPTNPLLVFAASVTSGTLQVAYSTYNDGSTTKPVVDIMSKCIITDN